MSAFATQTKQSSVASRTVVVGLGATGLSCARFLSTQGNPFTMVDSREQPPKLAEFQHQFPDAPLYLGCFDCAPLQEAEQIILSPGVSAAEPALAAASAAGAQIIGDIELFARSATAPVIAITGSNGKSTVTSLVGEMCKRAGKHVAVGGNLGVPALDLLNPGVELYVLELSSFQLESTYSLHPVAATVLNVSADHLDRHVTLKQYAEAKRRIFEGEGVMVLNADDSVVLAMAEPERRTTRFTLTEPANETDFGVRTQGAETWLMRGSTKLLSASELRLQGAHNLANSLAALALGDAAGLGLAPMLETLRSFNGLPHRCQWVAQRNGVDWYDDSKGTNVGATSAAISGLGYNRKLVLLAGGDGKGQDFLPLAEAAKDRLRCAVLIGRDAPLIAEALTGTVPVIHASSMAEAVTRAAAAALPGDAVLLSPACASFDMFANYVERAEIFTACVKQLP